LDSTRVGSTLRLRLNDLSVTKDLGYKGREIITAVKRFIAEALVPVLLSVSRSLSMSHLSQGGSRENDCFQRPGVNFIKLFWPLSTLRYNNLEPASLLAKSNVCGRS